MAFNKRFATGSISITYDTLCKLNQACVGIITCCRTLDELEIFDSEHLLFYRGLIRKLQSGMNHEVMHGMQMVEEQDWFRFGNSERFGNGAKNKRISAYITVMFAGASSPALLFDSFSRSKHYEADKLREF